MMLGSSDSRYHPKAPMYTSCSRHTWLQQRTRKQQRVLKRRSWDKKQKQRKKVAGIAKLQRRIRKAKLAKHKKTHVEEPRKGTRMQLPLFSWRQREIVHKDVPLLHERFMFTAHCWKQTREKHQSHRSQTREHVRSGVQGTDMQRTQSHATNVWSCACECA